MSLIDKIKLLWVVLQKGQELANKEAWKNVAAISITLQAIVSVVIGVLPEQYKALFDGDMQALLVAAIANVGGLLVALYLHFATSKSVGLPAADTPADPPTVTG